MFVWPGVITITCLPPHFIFVSKTKDCRVFSTQNRITYSFDIFWVLCFTLLWTKLCATRCCQTDLWIAGDHTEREQALRQGQRARRNIITSPTMKMMMTPTNIRTTDICVRGSVCDSLYWYYSAGILEQGSGNGLFFGKWIAVICQNLACQCVG